MKKLYKSTEHRVLSGVLGGISEYLNLDIIVVRLVFIALLVITGFFPFGIIYIIAAFLIPERPKHNTVSNQ